MVMEKNDQEWFDYGKREGIIKTLKEVRKRLNSKSFTAREYIDAKLEFYEGKIK
jgi:hypothetical protein